MTDQGPFPPSGTEVLLEDEVLRDGLQNEKTHLSVDQKLEVIAALAKAGVRRIQVGSFVHPKLVPQMADTDEVFARLEPRDGVTYTALVLNDRGLDRALAAGVKHLSISVSASETHSRKNLNRSVDDALHEIAPMITRAREAGIAVRAGIQSALGCGFEGHVDPSRVEDIARRFAGLGVQEVNLADTAGLANPRQVDRLCRRIATTVGPDIALSLHLHDTRGLGLANMAAGLAAGVRIFDAALGGLGGCPFIPRATGNIALEDAAYALQEMEMRTGIDWMALLSAVERLEDLLDRRLPGKMGHVDPPPWYEGDSASSIVKTGPSSA
ncbi:hydroxymethylglutaryl-CoA lyase [Salipiger sp. IMCC34102]|uniref:hydroxymethylglutaryl-CoA lyase n=1 Tax=Salipiger sp. IMCC34102 TaxID=2510647 RepID=UPI00101D232F|nr:hydroxymethylglutaryl-CoA lyase [Salipiger sp. IMCC34102]RYH04446.1 hydroxymethylglutaryl-CoA lyase [Salipiger sp. IMCC34102]